MAMRRGFEALLMLIIVCLFSLWTPRDQAENVSSPAREVSINGVSLGMTLDQVTARLGPSLSEVNGKMIGDIYTFGREPGALGYADFTGVQFDSEGRVSYIQGGRLELDGQRLAEDYWGLEEKERAETVRKLKEVFPEARFQDEDGAQRAWLIKGRLSISWARNASWTFHLGDRKD